MVMPFKPAWHDMSDYVVHFTKPYDGKTEYQNIMSICGKRMLRACNAFGIAKDKAPPEFLQKAVCFSEAPLDQLARLAEKRGEYAVGFTKSFVVSRGGGPIFYAYKDTPHHAAIVKLMSAATPPGHGATAIWRVTPFIDAPGQYGASQYFFEWEREWRHAGDLAFQVADVAFLVIPEKLHDAARSFFEYAQTENLGPAYLCPYIDIHWSLEKVHAELGAVLPH